MTTDGVVETLAERVHEVVARSEQISARSLVLIDASRYARSDETFVPRCAWCGRVALGGDWIERTEIPNFVLRAIAERSTDGICPTCFAQQLASSTSQILVHATNAKTADCLLSELQEYGVTHRPDHVLAVAVAPRDHDFVSQLLSRLADCLDTHALDPIQVRIGSHSYVLTGR